MARGAGSLELHVNEYHATLVADGRVYAWGPNDSGQVDPALGPVVATPVLVPLAGAAVQACAGAEHSCAVGTSGEVWCWGANDHGQLGRSTSDRVPARAELPGRASNVGCGALHSCAVLVDGTLWCWGNSHESQLGTGAYIDAQPAPVQVGIERDWQRVGGGQGHTCGIRAPGTLWCWGRNSAFNLGIGADAGVNWGTPAQVGNAGDWTAFNLRQDGTCGLRSDGSLWCWGENTSQQLGFEGPSAEVPLQIDGGDWAAIAPGTFHACGLRRDGRLSCWGRNQEGQLGLPQSPWSTPAEVAPERRWIRIYAGRMHSCGIAEPGDVYCTGLNSAGSLGIGAEPDRVFEFTKVEL